MKLITSLLILGAYPALTAALVMLLFGYSFVAGSSVAIVFLPFGVWAHHMFAVGLGDTENAIFSATSMLIAVPTG